MSPLSGTPARFSVRTVGSDGLLQPRLRETAELLQPRIDERPETFDLVDVDALVSDKLLVASENRSKFTSLRCDRHTASYLSV